MNENLTLFDEGIIDYDNIIDLWYSWLYSRLHFLIVKEVIMKYNTTIMLDVGCGTGFQSFLHSLFGSTVFGIDISKNMLFIAKNKILYFDINNIKLFPDKFNFVKKYNNLINSYLLKRETTKYLEPTFLNGDLYNLPFRDQYFDHINCCGSVLSLIYDSQSALQEMCRVLKSGGTMLIEVDSKWNIDRLWRLLDSGLMKNRLGYYSNFKENYYSTFKYPLKDCIINYPFGEYANPILIKLKLFNYNNLKNEITNCNLKIIKKFSIHSFTNIIPSVFLDTNYPSKLLIKSFHLLSSIEEKIPFFLPGGSLILLLKKEG